MTAFDYGIVVVLTISLLLGVWRGFVREVFSTAGWVAATALAVLYAQPLASHLPTFGIDPIFVGVIVLITIFILVLVLAGWLGLYLHKVIRSSGFGISDRALGGVFGLMRGIVVVLILVLAAGMTALPRQAFWRDSVLVGPFEAGAIAVKPYLPRSLAERVKFR